MGSAMASIMSECDSIMSIVWGVLWPVSCQNVIASCLLYGECYGQYHVRMWYHHVCCMGSPMASVMSEYDSIMSIVWGVLWPVSCENVIASCLLYGESYGQSLVWECDSIMSIVWGVLLPISCENVIASCLLYGKSYGQSHLRMLRHHVCF